MSKLPCIDYQLSCPFYDAKKGFCYGINPARKVAWIDECPKLEIARPMYLKQQQQKKGKKQ